MKKLFHLFAVLAMFAFASCDENGTDNINPNDKTEQSGEQTDVPENLFFGLDKESVGISPDGGSVDVIVYSNYKWTISGTNDWCTPSVTSGVANEDGQKVTFSAALTYDTREAIFWFRCADEKIKLTITQTQKDVIIAGEDNTFDVPVEGGLVTIAYQTSIGCEIIIPDDAKDWILFAETRALVGESATLNVLENTTYSARSAVIKVVAVDNENLAVEYTINQAQNDAIIADENNAFHLPYTGGSVKIDYQTNVECKVIIPEEAQGWISPTPQTRALTNDSVTLNIAENTTYSARSAVVKVVAVDNKSLVVEYTIVQEQNDDIIIDGDNLKAPADGGSVELNYQTNVDCEVIIPEEAQEWIYVAPSTRGLTPYTTTLVISRNESFDSRTATITIRSKDLTRNILVEQQGKAKILSISPSSCELSFEATSVNISIDSNVDYSVIIEESCDWISILKQDTNAITFNIAENPTIYERKDVILFKGDGIEAELTICQKGDEGVLMLQDEYFAQGQDTTLEIEFKSNFDYIITIPNNCNWLSVPQTRANLKDHTIHLSLTANPTMESRSIDIIFSDIKQEVSKRVRITQQGSHLEDIYNPADSEIYYITTDGNKITPNNALFGDIYLLQNTYNNGVGKLTFSGNVTKFGDSVFKDCSTLAKIAIPESVTSIGDYAFKGCSSLTSINIPDGVTSIGTEAFYGCSRLESITIPESVTSIGTEAFYDCTGELIINSKVVQTDYKSSNASSLKGADFTSLVIGDNISSIGMSAFWGCSSLESVTIPDSVTSIGSYAFYNCSSLANITIPDSVTSIGSYAFYGCSSLASVTIPDSVTSVGSYAFYGCSSLASVTIPDSVTSIGSYAFYGCSSLASVTIPDSVTSIGDSAFYNCSSLASVTIPDSVTSIGSYAFYGCSSLESVTIGDSVTSIGDSAFYNCSKLANITIPEGVTSIGTEAFYGCSRLESITIPESVTSIGDDAFKGCSRLAAVFITDISAWCNIFFHSYNSNPLYYAKKLYLNGELITDLTIPDGVTSIGSYAFYRCSSLESVTIPEGVTWIGSYAFCSCSSLESVTIGDSVTSIGERAFCSCSSLTSINIPDGVTSIRNSAFYGCSSLTSVTIPNSVTSIGTEAFYGCSRLESITIPDSVTSIGAYAFASTGIRHVILGIYMSSIGTEAFNWCQNLSIVYSNPITPPSIGSKVFTNNVEQIIVPDRSLEAYRNNWGEYSSKICSGAPVQDQLLKIEYTTTDGNVISPNLGVDILSNKHVGDGKCEMILSTYIRDIPADAFKNIKTLKSIIIPNNVMRLGQNAFSGCSSLESITIPERVTSIGAYAFDGCSSLANITIPEGVTSIGAYTFDGCSSLANITIPEGVTSIGERAFYNCSSLASVTIPDSVTSIGSDAFSGCTGKLVINNNSLAAKDHTYSSYPSKDGWLAGSNFTSLVIGNGVTSIGNYTFYKCSSLESITIPESVTSIGDYAFEYCTSLAAVDITDISAWCNIVFKSSGSTPLYYAKKLYLNGELITDLTIPEGVTSIGDYAFRNCSNLRSITIPDSVTSIGKYAFDGCSKLASINIPEGVTSIGSGAFFGCSSLASINIPESVTSIGDYAFKGCSSLTSINIPDGVTSIGTEAFYGCSRLASINIPKGVTSIGMSAFWGCSSLASITIPDSVTSIGYCAFQYCLRLASVTIPESVSSIGDSVFKGCSSLTSINIPDSVTSIGDSAFYNCSSLASINIPEGVTSIGSYAFNGCTGELVINSNSLAAKDHTYSSYPSKDGWLAGSNFTSLVIGNGVTSIGNYTFYKCSSLESVTIPDSVTSIGDDAFEYCSSLASITIPDSVTSIGDSAFWGCSSLAEVYCKPTTPPGGDSSMFSNNASGRKIYVPTKSVEAYKSARYWREYSLYIYGYDF